VHSAAAAPAPAAAAAPAPLAPDAIWAREQDPGYLPKKAIVTFNPPVTGAISFTQENWQAPVNIEVDLQNIPAVPAAWHVHRLPAKNGCCECTAGHYNPHNATTGYTSCPDPRDCEVGDLGMYPWPLPRMFTVAAAAVPEMSAAPSGGRILARGIYVWGKENLMEKGEGCKRLYSLLSWVFPTVSL
jgi:hypothetical protein